jgi:hypothetical protein
LGRPRKGDGRELLTGHAVGDTDERLTVTALARRAAAAGVGRASGGAPPVVSSAVVSPAVVSPAIISPAHAEDVEAVRFASVASASALAELEYAAVLDQWQGTLLRIDVAALNRIDDALLMVDGAAGHARVEAVEASVGGGDKLVGGGGLRVAGEGDESDERQQETLRHVDASSPATSI